MRWLFLFALGTLVGAGCEKTIYRSHESHYCSSKSNDEPYYECAKGSDLVCITTYTQTFGATATAPAKTVDIWLCRLGCTPGKDECKGDEVCCPGPIFGTNYGKDHACVLASLCPALAVPTNRDAGTIDAKPDAKLDGSLLPDAGAPDGDSDAPQGTEDAGADAPVDAPVG
jgi:hypothetical protein